MWDFLTPRKRKGLTQSEVADMLGVDRTTVTAWETGINVPGGKRLIKIAALYGCTIDDLMRDDEAVKIDR